MGARIHCLVVLLEQASERNSSGTRGWPAMMSVKQIFEWPGLSKVHL